MTTIEETNVAPSWQTFNVVGGIISRTKAGQVDGMLELGQGVAVTFIWDPDGDNASPDEAELFDLLKPGHSPPNHCNQSTNVLYLA